MENNKPKILIIFYSMTGNTAKLAKSLAEGSEEVNAEVRLRQKISRNC